jgi:hypothetical protein
MGFKLTNCGVLIKDLKDAAEVSLKPIPRHIRPFVDRKKKF